MTLPQARPLPPVCAIIFDFDGTLAATDIDFAGIRARLREYFSAHGCWDDSLFQRYILEMIDSVCARLPPAEAEEMRRGAMEIVHHGETEACCNAELYPGVAEALRELQARGYRLGIFTRNSRACCELVLRRHPLPYSALLTRDEVRNVKPHPAHLQATLERLGCPPERSLVVGDHYTDVETAVAAGAHAVGVLTTNGTRERFLECGAAMVLDSAADLPRVLGKLGTGTNFRRPKLVPVPNFPVGKLDPDLLAGLLGSAAPTDPRLILGPGIGRDVAVLDFGDRALVVKSDPVTFATDELGWYAVNVNANDLACAGAQPQWFLATLLLPEGRTDQALVSGIFRQLREACSAIGVSLIGGHTEVTYGLDRPIVCGQMLGEVPRDALVLPTGLQVGDAILMTKALAVEGTSLLAREMADRLAERGCSPDEIAQGVALLRDPGISVVAEAQALTSAVNVHAMHDPTEGGLATGLWEMAQAGGVGIDVDLDAVPIAPLCARFCALLGLDPLGLIASGTLLAAVAEADAETALAACRGAGLPCTRIGTATNALGVVRRLTSEGWTSLSRFDQDEIARLFAETG